MSTIENKEEQILKLVQKLLKEPPLIIWGSGATIPYGLPSMGDLKSALKPELNLDQKVNLETELEKINNQKKIGKIKKIIRDEVLKKDLKCLEKSIKDNNYFKAILNMIEKFYNAHPRKIDIVTTNYDCVLEYALSQFNYNFTDGFTGRPLSKFKPEIFEKQNIINLFKVHGSLNWFADENDNIFYLHAGNNSEQLKHVMILPAKSNKYQEVFKEPYRDLIAKSDEVIKQANSFFVVGFGFNDEHLTPKIESKIKEDTPIVIITKTATESCKNKLNNADKYCLFEKDGNGSKITFKTKSNSIKKTVSLEKNYWNLNQFMEVL